MSSPIHEGCVPPGKAAPFPGACRWLVSLDYDGTLRSADGLPVSPAFLKQMQQWRAEGLRWGINTGRSLPYLLEELLPCCPVLPDFICTCERYAYLAGKDGCLYPAEQHNEACFQANMALREAFMPIMHRALGVLRRLHPELLWRTAEQDPLSIEAPDAAMMDALMPHLQPLAEAFSGVAIQRAGRYMRFSDARFSKGTALAQVLSSWRVPPQKLFLMGDGHNDIDAFRLFPEAFCAAPSTAHPDVAAWLRAHGGYVSPEPGVLPALLYWYNHWRNRKPGAARFPAKREFDRKKAKK